MTNKLPGVKTPRTIKTPKKVKRKTFYFCNKNDNFIIKNNKWLIDLILIALIL
jgi:hypothetical protein